MIDANPERWGIGPRRHFWSMIPRLVSGEILATGVGGAAVPAAALFADAQSCIGTDISGTGGSCQFAQSMGVDTSLGRIATAAVTNSVADIPFNGLGQALQSYDGFVGPSAEIQLSDTGPFLSGPVGKRHRQLPRHVDFQRWCQRAIGLLGRRWP